MNSNTTALQTGHHHHHQATSTNTSTSQYHHPSTVTTQQSQQSKPAVNPNPSIHRYNSLNDPWQLQSQVQQQSQGPTPPLRQHKRPAPHPPLTVAIGPAAVPPKPNVAQLSINSTYNQPLHFTNAAQTQTTPTVLLAPTVIPHQQHSPKSPNQNFLHQPGASAGNLMSTSLNSGTASSMVNNHHHLPPQSHQTLSTSLHHSASSSLSNNNNNNNFDDLNLNGSSSIIASTSQQKKLDMKLNTMP